MKIKVMLSAVVAVAMMLCSCASTSQMQNDDDVRQAQQKEFDEFIQGAKDARDIPATGNATVDALAALSTGLYDKVGMSMVEYIEKVRGKQNIYELTNVLHTQEGNVEGEDFKESVEKYYTETLTPDEQKATSVAQLTETVVAQYNYDNFLTYMEKLNKQADDAAKAAFTEETKQDATLWASIELGKAEHAKRFPPEECNAMTGKLQELQNEAQQLQSSITEKIQAALADIKTRGFAALSEGKAWKTLGTGTGKQFKYDLKAIPWAISEARKMSAYGE